MAHSKMSAPASDRPVQNPISSTAEAVSVATPMVEFDAPTGSPEKALAAAVLRRATADLRRFLGAKDAVGREMYRDAASWFKANDLDWPYSFANVCRALDLSAESVLNEVFADADKTWYSHSCRVAGRMAKSVLASAARLFAARNAQPFTVAKL